MAENEQDHGELISSLLDGESDAVGKEQVAFVLAQNQTRKQWLRYQIIGDVLNGHGQGDVANFDLADRVRERVALEPAILAPRAVDRSRFNAPLAGVAIAASVAALAVIGVWRAPTDSAPQNEPISVASLDAADKVMRPIAAINDTPELEVDLAEHQRRLNSYLVNFNEQRSSLRMPGVNPYVRIVGFESE